MQVLVIGYGSIGQRHVTVLRDMGQHVSVVSGHLNTTEFPVYKTVEEAFSDRTFDYVVIAVPTGQHAALLRRLMPFLTDRMVCFVEKPVFASSMQKVSCDGLKIIVGYILRAHPLLRKARKILEGKRLYSCRASCGQIFLAQRTPGGGTFPGAEGDAGQRKRGNPEKVFRQMAEKRTAALLRG